MCCVLCVEVLNVIQYLGIVVQCWRMSLGLNECEMSSLFSRVDEGIRSSLVVYVGSNCS
jgi:hypothetical protein